MYSILLGRGGSLFTPTWISASAFGFLRLKFFEDLASYNDYEILELKIDDEKDILCSIRKTEPIDFMKKSDFDKLPLVTETGEFNDRDLYPYAYK